MVSIKNKTRVENAIFREKVMPFRGEAQNSLN